MPKKAYELITTFPSRSREMRTVIYLVTVLPGFSRQMGEELAVMWRR